MYFLNKKYVKFSVWYLVAVAPILALCLFLKVRYCYPITTTQLANSKIFTEKSGTTFLGKGLLSKTQF